MWLPTCVLQFPTQEQSFGWQQKHYVKDINIVISLKCFPDAEVHGYAENNIAWSKYEISCSHGMQSFDEDLEVFFNFLKKVFLLRKELCLCWMNIRWTTFMDIDDMDELRPY